MMIGWRTFLRGFILAAGAAYCYLSGLAVRLNATGNVESLIVFPGSDLRKICKAQ
jgi:hypothetical protein